MRLLTALLPLLLSLSLSAQNCLSGEGPLTRDTVAAATCVDYRTFLLLRDGTPYTIALSASEDSIAVVRFTPQQFVSRQVWAREGNTTEAVFLYNGYIALIREEEY